MGTEEARVVDMHRSEKGIWWVRETYGSALGSRYGGDVDWSDTAVFG